jgi:hypothetical protein
MWEEPDSSVMKEHVAAFFRIPCSLIWMEWRNHETINSFLPVLQLIFEANTSRTRVLAFVSQGSTRSINVLILFQIENCDYFLPIINSMKIKYIEQIPASKCFSKSKRMSIYWKKSDLSYKIIYLFFLYNGCINHVKIWSPRMDPSEVGYI